MKLESFKSPCVEVFVQLGDLSVTVNTWGNHEGFNLMVHGKGPELPLCMAGAFRWEEADAIIAAIVAARSTV
jgi:hypothetical protein